MKSVTTALLLISILFGGQHALAASSNYTFTRTLTLGSYGEDVRQLQLTLNSDPETRVSNTGAGSPGQESFYFGPKTKSAVVRFQQKYASQVLTPHGLTLGTGIVGPSTRSMLGILNTKLPSSTTATSSAITPPKQSLAITPVSQAEKNLAKLARFHEDVKKEAKRQGSSDAQIAIIDAALKKAAATSTDIEATFLKTVQNSDMQTTAAHVNPLDFLKKFAVQLVTPSHAHAATGIPFGGALIGAELVCNYESQYLIEIEPLPPTYAVFLTYTPGTQAYLSYNIPATPELLGFYTEPGICIIGACPYCYNFPTWGMITPVVGSAPL